MFDLNECVAFVTNIASKSLSEALNTRLMDYGVTKSQWIAMYYIEKEGNLTQKHLSDLMGAKESTTTGILSRLERDNLIDRLYDDKDKRKKTLNLTEKGKEVNKNLTKIAKDFRDACLEDVSEEDQIIFLNVIDKMVASSNKWKKNKV